MSRLITMLEDLREDLEGNELMSDDDMLANEESLTVQLDELSSSFEDLGEVDSLSAEMESYISTGNRLEAVQCSAKIQLVIKRLSDRHGIEYQSESLSLESLSDATWLEYQQENHSGIIFSVIVRILGVILSIVVAILILVKSKSSPSAPSSNKETKKIDMTFYPQININGGYKYDLEELVEARALFFTRVVPKMHKHLTLVCGMIEHTIRDLSDALEERDKWNFPSFTKVLEKWKKDYRNADKEAADAISSVNGIHVNCLFIYSDNTARSRIAHNSNVHEFMDHSTYTALNTSVVSEYISFAPYLIGHYRSGKKPSPEHINDKNISKYGGEGAVRHLLSVENQLSKHSPIKDMGKIFEHSTSKLKGMVDKFKSIDINKVSRVDRDSVAGIKLACTKLHGVIAHIPRVFRLLDAAGNPCIIDNTIDVIDHD